MQNIFCNDYFSNMPNELLIFSSFIIVYVGVIAFYRYFGRGGLLAFNVLATLLANIEVLLLVKAYGIEMTLGNVLFASTFLVTDILSENHGRKFANKAVLISTACSVIFIAISQLWLLYTPSENDWAQESFKIIFSKTPRIICASLIVYLVSQLVDVWLYHKWWDWCKKKFSDSKRGLWIRNNGSTMISQVLNTVLYTFLAFYGRYEINTLLQICLSTYLIYFVLSIINTPVIYLCRKIHETNYK